MSSVIVPAPSLIQGVSQQPPLLRFPSQAELQENAYPSAIDGLQKRQPLKHIASCFNGGAGDPLIHIIDRGDTERYAVIASSSTVEGASSRCRLRVFDLNTGAEKTVNGPGATTADFTYLELPENDYAFGITDPEFRIGTDWSVANNIAFGTQVAVIPPLGTRFDAGTNPTTHVYRIGNSAVTGATYTTNNGTEWPSALVTRGVTFSCFFHRDIAGVSAAGITLRLRTNGVTTRSVLFAISDSGAFTASVTTESLATGRVEQFPNGWFRLSITYVPTSAEVGHSARAAIVFPATNTATLLAWGARFDYGEEALDWLPRQSVALQALTVADYTFLLNTTRAARLVGSTSTEDPNQTAGFIFVAAGNYKTNYQVSLNRTGGVEQNVEVKTWDGTAGTDKDSYLFDVTTTGAAGNVWTMTVYNHTVQYINDASPTDQEVRTGLRAAIIAEFPSWSTNLFSVLADNTPTGQMTLTAKFAGQTIGASRTNGATGASTLTHVTDTESTSIKTDDIATALTAAINALGDGWAATAYGSVVKVTNASSDITKLECKDSRGDTNLYSIWGKVESFDILPTVCEHGHIITVAGDPVAAEDDYYVKFVAEQGSGVGKGVWVETVKPTNTGLSILVQTTMDGATMPHQLVRMANGTFEFGPITWTARAAGDDTTCPVPSFLSSQTVDRYINGMFFWKNRLGFISGQFVCMSETNVFFNFFRTTARALIDTDRIDAGAQHTKVVNLRNALPFDDSLFLFTDHTQFQLTHGEVLSPKSVQIAPILEYTAKSTVRPIVTARGVFFGTSRGEYDSVEQMVGSNNTNRVEVLDVGAHIPRYIPSDMTSLLGTDTESTLAVLSDGDPDSLFLYKYHDVGGDRLQSAWHKYTAGDYSRVLGGGFIGSTLFLVMQRYYGVTIESIRFAPGETDGSLGYLVALDRRFEAGPYTSVVGTFSTDTTWIVPYAIDPSAVLQVVRQDTGALITTTQATDASNVTTITAAGVDLSAVQMWIGCKYTMRYQPTEPVMREETRSGKMAVTSGRLQVLRGRLAFHDTQYVKVAVTPETRSAEYATWDTSASDDGYLNFMVGSISNQVAVEISNDTHRPSNLTSIEWECLYTTRSARTPA